MCQKKLADQRIGIKLGRNVLQYFCVAALLATISYGQSQPSTLVVLPPQAKNLSPDDAKAFESEIDRTFQSNPDARYVAPDASALKSVGADQGCSDLECAIQAGRVMESEHVVYSVVRKEDDKWIMTLRLVDARSGETMESKSGLSTSGTASAAATDFAAALTDPLVVALHSSVPVASAPAAVAQAPVAAPVELPPVSAPVAAAPVSSPSFSEAPAAVAATPAVTPSVPEPVAAAPAPTPAPVVPETVAAAPAETAAPVASAPVEPAPAPAPVVLPPAPVASAPDATASTESSGSSDSSSKKKIVLWTIGGLVVAGGAAAAVLLMSGSSSSNSSGPAPTPSGTMNVVVKLGN